MSDFWAFSIAGYFLPLILRAKGVDTSQSVTDTYRSYVWICEQSQRSITLLLTESRFTWRHRYLLSCSCELSSILPATIS